MHMGVENNYKLDTQLEKAFCITDLIAVPERSSLHLAGLLLCSSLRASRRARESRRECVRVLFPSVDNERSAHFGSTYTKIGTIVSTGRWACVCTGVNQE